MDFEFKNGSKVTPLRDRGNVRGDRSKYMVFIRDDATFDDIMDILVWPFNGKHICDEEERD